MFSEGVRWFHTRWYHQLYLSVGNYMEVDARVLLITESSLPVCTGELTVVKVTGVI